MELTHTQHVFEEWKPIVGYEGRYEVSSMGRVRSLDMITVKNSRWGHDVEYRRRGRILKPRPRGVGKNVYGAVHLGKYGKDKPVHRLVAITFFGSPKLGQVVNHKNGEKDDNRAANLEWVTQRENIQHSFDTGLNHGNRGKRGKQLSLESVSEIRGKYQKELGSVLAKRYNTSQATISKIRHNKIFKTI